MMSFFRICTNVSLRRIIGQSRRFTTGQCQVEELKERGLIQVLGKDSSHFLQGLMTNDMRILDPGDKLCIYTMFLNTKGRIMYDALVYKESDESFLIECDSSSVNELAKHLTMFRLRKKVEIVPEPNRNVRVVFGLIDKIEKTSGILVKDPRLPDLGHRFISSPNQSLPCNSVEGLYKETRFKLGIGEGESELSKGETFPLEMNVDFLGGVSFDKGCYLGQEVTSRTKYTGVVRKRLMPLEFSSSIPTSPDLVEKIEGKREKRLGKVKAVYGTLGLGLMRITEMASPALSAAGIIVKQPKWWPQQIAAS